MNTWNTNKRSRTIYWLLPTVLALALAVWLGQLQATVTAQRTLPGTLPTGTLPTLDTVVRDQSFGAPRTFAQELTSEQGWGFEHPRLLADVNGDKRQDVVGFGNDGVWLATSNGTSFNPAFVLANFGYNQSWRVQKHVRTLGDINGDGRDDVVGFGYAGVYRALSTGTGFGPIAFVVANFGYDQGWRVEKHERLLGDVNGDGREDIVGFGTDGVWLALAASNGTFPPSAFVLANFGYDQGWTPAKHIRTLADLNGDGKQDIVGFGEYGVWTALSTGNGFAPAHFVFAGFAIGDGGWRVDRHPRLLVDINRDRKADIVGFGNDGVWTALSTGNGGFAAAQFVLADFGYDQGWRTGKPFRFDEGVPQTGCTVSTCEMGINPRFVTDLNHDGYQDIVGFGDATVYRALGGPTGFGSVRGVLREFVTDNGHPWRHYPDVLPSVWPRFVGDVNGDGLPDLVAFDAGEIKVARSSDQPPPPPPTAPSNVRITGATASSLSIAWNDNSNDERKFFINYRKANDVSDGWHTATVSANNTTFVLSSLASDTLYNITVQAENRFDVSAERGVYGRTNSKPQPTPTPTPAPTPTPTGFSSINVFNCNVDQRPVFIWTRDVTQSTWVQRGSLPAQYTNGSCPGNSAPLAVPLQDGHSFWFVAVDPQLIGCGGQNNPESSACQRSIFTQPLPGKANGPVLRHVIN
jgi:hypothetical protein